MKILTEDLRIQCEMKLREQEKLFKCQYEMEVHGFKVQEEKNLSQKKKLKEEIASLQKQLFWVKMRAITAVIIKYKQTEQIGPLANFESAKNIGDSNLS